jgi:Glycosyl transferase family 2
MPPFPGRRLARRTRDRFIGPLAQSLDLTRGSVDGIRLEVDALRGEAQSLARQVGALGERLDDVHRRLEETGRRLGRTVEALHYLTDEVPENRRRLHALRASEEYELAFTEEEPLVSFILPTYLRYDKLRDVALPSILNQTYRNVEAIVVGDGAPPEAAEVVTELGDPRVRYVNRTVRGPYPGDDVRWYMLGTPPYNDGLSLVRGRWITAMADDDAVRPSHTETLLSAARELRVEHCYGRHQVHYQDGNVLELGAFPPEKGKFVMQASIYHSGLRFFQMGTADYLFEEPNDWSYCRRMLQVGVSFAMVDEIVCDKYESRYERHDDWGVHGIPRVE